MCADYWSGVWIPALAVDTDYWGELCGCFCSTGRVEIEITSGYAFNFPLLIDKTLSFVLTVD